MNCRTQAHDELYYGNGCSAQVRCDSTNYGSWPSAVFLSFPIGWTIVLCLVLLEQDYCAVKARGS
jgi:hypothetical protein